MGGIMAESAAVRPIENEPAERDRHRLAHLLEAPLTPTLLGERLSLDFYARNGFRFLAIPAWADADLVTRKLQQFRGLVRIDPQRALAGRVPTLPDSYMNSDAVLQAVARLTNPRHRLVSEFFWPHVQEADLHSLARDGGLGSTHALELLAAGQGSPTIRAQRLHARALAAHCLAIGQEIEFMAGRAAEPARLWEQALTLWRELLQNQDFWSYIRARADRLDDHRLQAEDIDKASGELAAVVLSIHEVLAEGYAAQQRYPECLRHIRLIQNSKFDPAVVREATARTAKKVAGARLETLLARTTDAVAGIKEKMNRGKFETLAGPLVQEASEIHALLTRRLEIPSEILEQSAFDHIAEKLNEAVNKKLLYEGDQRERNILYSSLFNLRLLRLPLSPVLRRKIENSNLEDRRLLYSRFGLDANVCPDPTKCFFIDGVEADPDASLTLDMHRITKREITADRLRGSAGISVNYTSYRVLVPRSRLAADAKSSTVQMPIEKSRYTAEQAKAAEELSLREREIKTIQDSIDLESRTAIDRENQDCKLRLEQYRKQSRERRSAAEAEVGKLQKLAKRDLELAERAYQESAARIRKEHGDKVSAATRFQAANEKRFSGMQGFLRAVLPTALAGALLAWFRLSENMGPLSLVLGLGLGVLVGQIVRTILAGRGERRVRRAERNRDTALEKRAAAWAKQKKTIEQKFAVQRRPHEEVLAALNAEEDSIQKTSATTVSRIRNDGEKKKEAGAARLAKETRRLREKLTLSATVKPASSKTSFAPYVSARKNGFVDGIEPSSYEMQMTESERSQARLKLMGL
jgi:hypothetical protein